MPAPRPIELNVEVEAEQGPDVVIDPIDKVDDCSRIISVAQTQHKTKGMKFTTVNTANVEDEAAPEKEHVPEAETVKEEQKVKAESKGTVISSLKSKYTIERVLGRGGFGVVYKVKCKDTGNVYALKTEEKTTSRVYQRLKCEAWIMFCMSTRNSQYFLDLIDSGQTDAYHFVVMPLIGRSLDVVKKNLLNNDNYSHSTVVNLMLSTLTAVEDMHACGFLHRDIKPANFAIGLEQWEKLYILDFGISRHFRDHDGSIIRPRKCVPFIGTLRYAPRSCHAGMEYGRVGDLESWFYMGLEMWDPNFLPWASEPDKSRYFEHKKSVLSSLRRYDYERMPNGFAQIGMYLGKLDSIDAPDYTFIREMLRDIPNTNPEVNLNEEFDWLKKEVMHRAKIKEAEAREQRKAEGLSQVTNQTAFFVYRV